MRVKSPTVFRDTVLPPVLGPVITRRSKSYKGQVNGMVHDQSSTGSTFFIEPAAIVNLNNQLREFGRSSRSLLP